MSNYQWNSLALANKPPEHGDIRRITIEVEVVFRKSEIITDWDSETGKALECEDGFVMDIITRSAVYKGEPSIFLAHGKL